MKKKKTRKRFEKRNKVIKYQDMKLFGINAAGIKSKLKSLTKF